MNRPRPHWADPTSGPPGRGVRLQLPDLDADLRTERGLFAASGIDRGTRALLRHVTSPRPHTGVLDLGTGYGPIALTLAHRQPTAGIWAVDIDPRARALARTNTAGLHNVVVAAPDDVPTALRFDDIYSNPPIKIGKPALRELLAAWLARLVPGSSAWLVVKQAMGADSLHTWMNDNGFPTSRAASKQGYRILRVTRPGPTPPALADDNLAAVRDGTGVRWTVLGRLSVNSPDPLHLVQGPTTRAVLKIKTGGWWEGQLDRLAPLVESLRLKGYPTPSILGTGRLGGDRSYLLTTWATGVRRRHLLRADLMSLLDAVEMQYDVAAPPERDWSAMITLFLNGGISGFEFHPSVAGLAQRTLALLPKPVPPLPTGAFVHGSLSIRNILFDADSPAALLGIEAFGAGTPVIDLVSLLGDVAHASDRRTAIDMARDRAGDDVVTACLCHRVLAGLAWASDHPDLLATATDRAERLLSLVPDNRR